MLREQPGGEAAAGWGSSSLRRATYTLAATQLLSWGVLFYGFAVVAPQVTEETGWSESVVSAGFSLALLVSGFAAPVVARRLARHDPRLVLTTGSLLGVVGMGTFAVSPNLPVFYAAWFVVGCAMAATLYEPAMAVLVALDPARRVRTLTALTITGGLASTAFAPLTGALADAFGWRAAILVLAVTFGCVTALLHAIVLPPPVAPSAPVVTVAEAPPEAAGRLRVLRTAVLFEQAAVTATTVHLVGMLSSRGLSVALAAAGLGLMGLGKVFGRLLIPAVTRRSGLAAAHAACAVVQLTGLVLPLVTTTLGVLAPTAVVVGAASGMTTILRPLLIVEVVGVESFALVNARIQRATTVARAGAPFALGAAVTAFGWPAAWIAALLVLAAALQRYLSLRLRST